MQKHEALRENQQKTNHHSPKKTAHRRGKITNRNQAVFKGRGSNNKKKEIRGKKEMLTVHAKVLPQGRENPCGHGLRK